MCFSFACVTLCLAIPRNGGVLKYETQINSQLLAAPPNESSRRFTTATESKLEWLLSITVRASLLGCFFALSRAAPPRADRLDDETRGRSSQEYTVSGPDLIMLSLMNLGPGRDPVPED